MGLQGSISLADKNVLELTSGFRFGVEIGGEKVAWFTECSGLSIEREALPQKEGGQNAYVHQLPGRVSYPKVTLKRGIADMALWKWFREGLYDLKVKRQPVSIILYSGDRQRAKRWDLKDAFPTKWTGPDLKTDSNQVAVEGLELVHHGFEMDDWSQV
jgi:phage tail-like protein